ncbi:unnamed protein product [Durusdinium trenchii]|uniref:Protein phosphatase n=1 Tax=Durusdinium trenchii TaxID=1381693 RepID=A0ABP0IPV3_9DINO
MTFLTFQWEQDWMRAKPSTRGGNARQRARRSQPPRCRILQVRARFGSLPEVTEDVLPARLVEEFSSATCMQRRRAYALLPQVKEPEEEEVELDAGGCSFGKAKGQLNADSFFHSAHSVGAADGVSQWLRFGINCRAFSDELMQGCQDHLLSSTCDCPKRQCLEALTASFHEVQSFGSATVVIATLIRQHLGIAALGDAALMLLRWGADDLAFVVCQTTEQQYRFNVPYQLAHVPQEIKERVARARRIKGKKGTGKLSNVPEDAELMQVVVQPGDLLILGPLGMAGRRWCRRRFEPMSMVSVRCRTRLWRVYRISVMSAMERFSAKVKCLSEGRCLVSSRHGWPF